MCVLVGSRDILHKNIDNLILNGDDQISIVFNIMKEKSIYYSSIE